MKLSEDEILNYLMTSEFEEGLTPEEFKFLLKKFRNFYRILRGRYDLSQSSLGVSQKEVHDLKLDKEIRYNELLYQKNILEDFNKSLLNRKLSWKERWQGKIIIDENENIRL